MRAIFVFFLFPSLVWAQTKAATIDGPVQAPVGTLVELKADSTVASEMAWVLATSDVQGLQYRTYEKGRVCVFAAPKTGRYEFALIIVIVTAENKPVIAIERHVIDIVGGGPVPPGPSPDPDPMPPDPGPLPTPSDFTSLTKVAKDTAPASKKAEVRLNFRTLASAVGAGTIKSWPDLVTKTAAGNSQIFGDPDDEGNPWQDFVYAIGEELDSYRKANKLNTPASWSQAWFAIAEGLN